MDYPAGTVFVLLKNLGCASEWDLNLNAPSVGQTADY